MNLPIGDPKRHDDGDGDEHGDGSGTGTGNGNGAGNKGGQGGQGGQGEQGEQEGQGGAGGRKGSQRIKLKKWTLGELTNASMFRGKDRISTWTCTLDEYAAQSTETARTLWKVLDRGEVMEVRSITVEHVGSERS